MTPSKDPMDSTWETVADCLDAAYHALDGSDCFYGHGTDNAWDEAVALVLDTLGLPPDTDRSVLDRPLPEFPEFVADTLRERLRKRIKERLPLPYITGRAYFAGLEFIADPRTLIPRSPLAELILQEFQPWLLGSPETVLDVCCGGGCIGLATAVAFPRARVDLVDLDCQALAQATENTQRLGLAERTRVLQGDLFSACTGCTYDLILCNPPYVDAEDMADLPSEYLHEPQGALAAGDDGLDLVRRLLREAGVYLNPGGLMIVEVGNSWTALEEAFPAVSFMWLEFEHGGHGVFAMTAEELSANRESFA